MTTLPITVSPVRMARLRSALRDVSSFPVLLGGFLVVFVFLRVHLVPFFEGDTWWHLTAGESILETGHWPHADPYSFTVHGNEWIAYEWLGEVGMALAYRLGGLRGLVLLLLGILTTLVLLLYYYCYLCGKNAKAAFAACLVLLPPLAIYFNLRPQLVGFAFLVVTLICLEKFRQGERRAIWVLPPLFVVWVNTHGSFFFGFLVLGLYWVAGLTQFRAGALFSEAWTAEQRRRLGLCFLLCLLVLPVTPYGTRLAAYPLEMALWQPINTGTNGEFQPLPFDSALWKLLLVALLSFFLTQLVAPRPFRVEQMGLLLFAIYLTLTHRRFVLLLVPLLAPLLAAQWGRWFPQYEPAKDQYLLNAALLALMIGGMVAFFHTEREFEDRVAEQYPRKAVRFLREHPVPGPMFNDYDWGGYLSRSLGPGHRVFIDGRADIYEYGGVLADYLSITRLEAHVGSLLRKYNVQSGLVRQEQPITTWLAASPDWELTYQDERSALFVRKTHPKNP